MMVAEDDEGGREDAAEAGPLPPPTIDDEANLDAAYAITAAEREALAAFDAAHPNHAATGTPPGKRLRFLRARKLNVDKAHAMLENHQAWFERVRPNELTEEQVDQKALHSGCWRYLGNSNDGSPVLEVRVAKWNPHEYSKDAYVAYVGFFMAMTERVCAKHTKYIVLFDMRGWALWHAKYLSYIKQLVDIAQNQYPERLRQVMMLNAPLMFRGAWKIIRPWLDPVTAAKIKFVSGKNAMPALLAGVSVPREMIPGRYGGLVEDDSVLPCPGYKERMGPAAGGGGNHGGGAAEGAGPGLGGEGKQNGGGGDDETGKAAGKVDDSGAGIAV